jgi:hypothetical protein
MRKTIDLLYHGVNLTIDGDYYPARKGSDYLRNGDPGNPPESAEFIIDRVRIGEVEVIDMFDGLKDTEASLDRPPYCLGRIEELALEKIEGGEKNDLC